jgi:hypothetical protein
MQDKSSVQQKVQELCDCYAETDPLKGMTSVFSESDKEEAALKWLALAVLHGIDQNAEEIKLYRSSEGNVKATAEYRKRELPLPDGSIGRMAMEALRQMTHIEGDKGKVPLSLGIRDSGVEIVVKVKGEDGSEKITLEFPK